MRELRIEGHRYTADSNGVWYVVAPDGVPGQVTAMDVDTALDEVARLRVAITEAIADLDGSHYVNEHGDMCAVCGAADGAWPCAARQVADDLRRAVGT